MHGEMEIEIKIIHDLKNPYVILDFVCGMILLELHLQTLLTLLKWDLQQGAYNVA